ncbi:unnamed protein product [Sphagnum jensenii]|uniref:Uncharacterized protein n=1 Tax=Sphagnum jensenii TaxID=128206 RepID=A0ABP1AV07_9BRYO
MRHRQASLIVQVLKPLLSLNFLMISNAGYRGLKHLQAIGTERWFPLRERLWQLQTNLRWGRLCNRQLTYGLTMQVNKEKYLPRK